MLRDGLPLGTHPPGKRRTGRLRPHLADQPAGHQILDLELYGHAQPHERFVDLVMALLGIVVLVGKVVRVFGTEQAAGMNADKQVFESMESRVLR
ncbi:hypothetical protein ACWT_3534 [Actinoplanes sp. SE50]|uniref:hypothetical protein n=1 Tax=unclassified Actinoplanes TaxID=2626549 RepID=UPI00023EBF1A|nr:MULTISPECIES: hypothetical protein [unclassified Actinoplanes]AEV84557.1 hypothetical protein ACPL_3662 [Actinoplanes sp. SE50/110]ATO82949.1 hypothetical protein ACWT_3534 [Actinoplanes sp. SE50]SLM00357.1 hypothetical protein ACSP50_3589 [Actinoplanes sp. SE50/110]